jgi:hypothetical protein
MRDILCDRSQAEPLQVCWWCLVLLLTVWLSPPAAHAHSTTPKVAGADEPGFHLPERFAPLEIVLPNGSRLGIAFATQLRVSVLNDGDDSGGTLGDPHRNTDDLVEFRRVRLLLRGSFLDEHLLTLAQFSFAPSSPELVDLWAEYVVKSALRIRVGQEKIPFTRHRGQSFLQLPLTEWDVASVSFGAERQIGVMVHDGLRGDGHLNYALGLFSGVNARSAFARGIAEVYAEPLPNRSSFRTPPLETQIHPEFVGLIGYSSPNMDNTAPTDPEGGAARFFTGLSGAWDVQPDEVQDFFGRLAPELLLKVHHVSLDLVGYAGFFQAPQGAGGLGMLGLTSDLTYRFHPRMEVAARYSLTDTLDRLRDAARNHARSVEESIEENGDPGELAAVQEQYVDAGHVRSQQEIELGFNVYIVGRNLAWQTDLGLVRTDRIPGGIRSDNDLVRVRTQLQLAF